MLKIPPRINSMLENERFQPDNTGLSGSSVYLFDNQVLKIQEDNAEAENEYIIMEWLKDKLPAPKVLAREKTEGKSYLLMTRIKGKMSCDDEYMSNPAYLSYLLAKALKQLWQTDITNCPCTWNIDRKLEIAKYRIDNNMVDTDNAQEDTYGENGFASPHELYQWLLANKPLEDLVLSHGDFTLPNVLFEGASLKGYIDLGKMGAADKWCDIALCYRSLLNNYKGKYGGKKYDKYNPEIFFQNLGLEPDWDKIRYYILLDELF